VKVTSADDGAGKSNTTAAAGEGTKTEDGGPPAFVKAKWGDGSQAEK